MSKFGGGSWGSWHTSDAVIQVCPQGCDRMHTVEEAVALNDKEREFNQAKMYARTKEWMQK